MIRLECLEHFLASRRGLSPGKRGIPCTGVRLLAREVVANLAFISCARPGTAQRPFCASARPPHSSSADASTLALLQGFELAAAFINLTAWLRLSEGTRCIFSHILLQALLHLISSLLKNIHSLKSLAILQATAVQISPLGHHTSN